MRTFAAMFCMLITAAGPLRGADGISVAGHWSGSSYSVKYYTLSRFRIRDDRVVEIDALVQRADGYGACYPTINHAGTHVAFCLYENGQWRLAVMALTPEAAICHLTDLPGRTPLEWCTDGCVYYLVNQTELHRIEVRRGAVAEKAFTFPNALAVMRMSADASRMHTFNASNDRDWRLWWQRDGQNGYHTVDNASGIGGCSPGVSPSGRYALCYKDPAHVHHKMHGWDVADPEDIHDRQLNQWAVTPEGAAPMLCGDEARPLGHGGGTLGHGWSCNADRWAITRMGTDSRFFDCGSNQIVFDWIGKKAINVTSGYRRCKSDGDVSRCDIGTGNLPGGTVDKHAETGDFWVATIEEVNPELACYLSHRDEWRVYWSAMLSGEQASDIGCPAGSAPAQPHWPDGPMRRPVARHPVAALAGTAPASSTVQVIDSRGRIVAAGDACRALYWRKSLPAGVYAIVVRYAGRTVKRRFAIP
jgi:hypothetical protein